MLYFDTSFVVPLVLDKPTSTRIQRFMADLPKDRLAISQWTRVEFSSVLGHLVRMGDLDAQAASIFTLDKTLSAAGSAPGLPIGTGIAV